MIVPSMTLEEMRLQIRRDHDVLYRKSGHMVKKLRHDYFQQLKRKDMKFFFNYVSKYKNTWIYCVNMSKKTEGISFMVYFNNKRGLNAFYMFTNGWLVYCTSHFFTRYNERRKLNLTQPYDIMKSFMADNALFEFRIIEEINDDIGKFFCATTSGVILGTQNKPAKLWHANTFLTSDMLYKNQSEMEQQLKLSLDKYVPISGSLDK